MDIILDETNKYEVALNLFLDGESKQNACDQAGVTMQAFTKFLNRNPTARAAWVKVSKEKLIRYYERVVDAEARIIESLLVDAEEDLPIKDRVTILHELQAVAARIETVTGVSNTPEESQEQKNASLEASKFLKSLGPKLASGRVTVTQTKMEVEGGE